MIQAEVDPSRIQAEPLPENIRGVQPGGGVCYRIELAWGRLRRWYLRIFRPGYVRRMSELRRGRCDGAPHEIIDTRDLKYCWNLCEADWPEPYDRFAWRDRLPFARWGLAELQLMGVPLLAAMVGFALLPTPFWGAAVLPGVALGLLVFFFRDPPRQVPSTRELLVSPADGKVVEVANLDHDPFVGGPAVRIAIFLSLFNVHINRAPARARVIRLEYHPGEFLNAMRPESALRNESMWIGLEEDSRPHRRLIVRQISGMVARRIVCRLRSGQVVDRGEKFGMIKLGSRTELILPADEVSVEIPVGARVKAGSSVLARWVT